MYQTLSVAIHVGGMSGRPLGMMLEILVLMAWVILVSSLVLMVLNSLVSVVCRVSMAWLMVFSKALSTCVRMASISVSSTLVVKPMVCICPWSSLMMLFCMVESFKSWMKAASPL